jgi:hypothetical protein
MRVDFSDDCDGDAYALVVSKLAGCQVVLRWRTLKAGQQHTYHRTDVDGVVVSADSEGVMLTHTDKNGEPIRSLPSGEPVRSMFKWDVVEKVTYQ